MRLVKLFRQVHAQWDSWLLLKDCNVAIFSFLFVHSRGVFGATYSLWLFLQKAEGNGLTYRIADRKTSSKSSTKSSSKQSSDMEDFDFTPIETPFGFFKVISLPSIFTHNSPTFQLWLMKTKMLVHLSCAQSSSALLLFSYPHTGNKDAKKFYKDIFTLYIVTWPCEMGKSSDCRWDQIINHFSFPQSALFMLLSWVVFLPERLLTWWTNSILAVMFTIEMIDLWCIADECEVPFCPQTSCSRVIWVWSARLNNQNHAWDNSRLCWTKTACQV